MQMKTGVNIYRHTHTHTHPPPIYYLKSSDHDVLVIVELNSSLR